MELISVCYKKLTNIFNEKHKIEVNKTSLLHQTTENIVILGLKNQLKLGTCIICFGRFLPFV